MRAFLTDQPEGSVCGSPSLSSSMGDGDDSADGAFSSESERDSPLHPDVLCLTGREQSKGKRGAEQGHTALLSRTPVTKGLCRASVGSKHASPTALVGISSVAGECAPGSEAWQKMSPHGAPEAVSRHRTDSISSFINAATVGTAVPNDSHALIDFSKLKQIVASGDPAVLTCREIRAQLERAQACSPCSHPVPLIHLPCVYRTACRIEAGGADGAGPEGGRSQAAPQPAARHDRCGIR